jgi:anti-sigma B factor antagonist
VSKVILDLTALEYIDSSGIGMIALASGRLREAGGRMVVVVPEGRVLQLLKIAGVDALLTISGTLPAAATAVA